MNAADDRCPLCHKVWEHCFCYPRHPGSALPAETVLAEPVTTDTAALYDTLNLLSLSVLASEGGHTAKAQTALLEAQVAYETAFPAGSPESDALWVILVAVGLVQEAAA